MKNMRKENRQYIATIAFLCIVAGVMWIIGNAGLLAPDEYNYSNIYGTTQRITSLADLRTSLSLFYTSWTGRILVHGMIQLFLWLNVNVFYIMNSIVFVIFLIGIVRLFNEKVSVGYLAIALALIIYGTAVFSEKYIWISGSLNYLWPTCVMLYTLRYFYKGIAEQEIPNRYKTALYWILAFVTGFSQENIAFVTGSFILILIFSRWKELIKLSKKEILYWITGILCFGIGALLLIFAPGNLVRFHGSDGTGIYTCIYNIARNLFHIKYLIVVYLITLFLIYRKEKKQSEKLEICKKQIIYVVLPCVVAMVPMLIIAEFYDRAMLPYEVLLIAGCIYNIKELVANSNTAKKCESIVSVVSVVMAIVPMARDAVFSVNYLKPYKLQIEAEAEQQIHDGKKVIILKQFEQKDEVPNDGIISKEFFFDSLNTDIRNYYAARYYGAEALYCVPDNMCQMEFELDTDFSTEQYQATDENGEVVAEQIEDAEHPVLPLESRIVFQVPKDEYLTLHYQLPQEVQSHITKVVCRVDGEEKIVDTNDLRW